MLRHIVGDGVLYLCHMSPLAWIVAYLSLVIYDVPVDASAAISTTLECVAQSAQFATGTNDSFWR